MSKFFGVHMLEYTEIGQKVSIKTVNSIDKAPSNNLEQSDVQMTDCYIRDTMRVNWKLSTWVHASHPIETLA